MVLDYAEIIHTIVIIIAWIFHVEVRGGVNSPFPMSVPYIVVLCLSADVLVYKGSRRGCNGDGGARGIDGLLGSDGGAL